MWKLMSDDAITQEERQMLSDFVLNSSKLTQGEKVKEFENAWSEWMGVKHSVFVNSGSSANLLVVQAAHDLYSVGDWTAQSCTWATNIAPIMQLGGGLHLVDTDLQNLGPSCDDLELLFHDNEIKYLFLTHLLGIPAFTDKLIELCEKHNVMVFEDCCESHGATWKQNKVGTFGKASTFSFYYGHHMTTIEGGMICTNDTKFYEHLLLLRSHGLLRELPTESRKNHVVDGVNEKFTFLCPGYNVRSSDLNAVLGLSQIKKMDDVVKRRNQNLVRYLSQLDDNKYLTHFPEIGTSSFAFPIITSGDISIHRVEEVLENNSIECRPLIAGNLARHPMCLGLSNDFPVSDYIHDNGLYVGNSEFVDFDMIDNLVNILNTIGDSDED